MPPSSPPGRLLVIKSLSHSYIRRVVLREREVRKTNEKSCVLQPSQQCSFHTQTIIHFPLFSPPPCICTFPFPSCVLTLTPCLFLACFNPLPPALPLASFLCSSPAMPRPPINGSLFKPLSFLPFALRKILENSISSLCVIAEATL